MLQLPQVIDGFVRLNAAKGVQTGIEDFEQPRLPHAALVGVRTYLPATFASNRWLKPLQRQAPSIVTDRWQDEREDIIDMKTASNVATVAQK
ncbi:MAG: hypothetical protein OXC63_15620 [Aestuariivita sp.]|nr:hypothetical protein [Aestuariivita sp.]